jgi:hypothetical protein
MQSLETSSPAGTSQTLINSVAPVTAGWLIRRMVLWFLLVALGVAGACLLYMAASKAEAESVARSTGSQTVARAIKG